MSAVDDTDEAVDTISLACLAANGPKDEASEKSKDNVIVSPVLNHVELSAEHWRVRIPPEAFPEA